MFVCWLDWCLYGNSFFMLLFLMKYNFFKDINIDYGSMKKILLV